MSYRLGYIFFCLSRQWLGYSFEYMTMRMIPFQWNGSDSKWIAERTALFHATDNCVAFFLSLYILSLLAPDLPSATMWVWPMTSCPRLGPRDGKVAFLRAQRAPALTGPPEVGWGGASTPRHFNACAVRVGSLPPPPPLFYVASTARTMKQCPMMSSGMVCSPVLCSQITSGRHRGCMLRCAAQPREL